MQLRLSPVSPRYLGPTSDSVNFLPKCLIYRGVIAPIILAPNNNPPGSYSQKTEKNLLFFK